MIIKSKSIKSIEGTKRALYYILTGHTNKERGFVVTNCIRGDRSYNKILEQETNPERVSELTEQRIANMLSQFIQNNDTRTIKRENGNVAYHEIISFHRKDTDKLPSEVLQKIARKYIKERSQNSLVVSTMHSDREHLHIHFVISSVEFAAGKVVRKTRKEFEQVKVRMENYQNNELGLTFSKVEHVKKKLCSKTQSIK